MSIIFDKAKTSLERITDMFVYNKYNMVVKTDKNNWYLYEGDYNDVAIGVTDFHFKIITESEVKSELEQLAKK